MIDVILCCYNQENTIQQALESIYSQKTDDVVNIIVADDMSNDKTLEIIKSIPKKKGFEISILESENRLGLEKNYQRAFAHCKNEFVFILEGDDWWSSENHIKQHVNFLRENQDVSMTMNWLELINEESVKLENNWNPEWGDYKRWTIRDQIHGNKLGNLSGCCFRGELIQKLPESLYQITFADWLLGILMAQYGDIVIFKESTSVYRIRSKGQWSGLSEKEQKHQYIELAKLYDKFLDYKYTKDFSVLIKSLNMRHYESSIIYKILKKIKKILKQRLYILKFIFKKMHAVKISDNKSSVTDIATNGKIAIHFHVFYTDLLNEIYTYVSKIKVPYTLFISVVSDKDKEFVEKFFNEHKMDFEVKIIRVDNRGRDIYPFYLSLHDCYQDYDIIAHFHTKRSFHTDYGDKWRRFLYNNLLGKNHLFENIVKYLYENKTVGFISTPIVPIKSIIYSYYDFLENRIDCKDAISNSLKVFGVDGSEVYSQPVNLDFPCGNMFIARTEAIKQFFSTELDENVFPKEEGQLSGTLQHYVELIWHYIVKLNGYKYLEIKKAR